jgi:hypothetical protein
MDSGNILKKVPQSYVSPSILTEKVGARPATAATKGIPFSAFAQMLAAHR